jgi:hypothetical protein
LVLSLLDLGATRAFMDQNQQNSVAGRSKRLNDCKKLTKQLDRKLAKTILKLKNNTRTYLDVGRNKVTSTIIGQPDCSVTDYSTMSRSLCPWGYVVNRDLSRYPNEILEARRCSDSDPDVDPYRLSCEEIYMAVPVLRLVERKRRKTTRSSNIRCRVAKDYKEHLHMVVVGFTAAYRPRS